MPGHQIQRMLPRHFKILQLRLAGLSQKAIAQMVGCSEQAVGIVVRSPIFQAEYQRRLKEQNNGEVEEEIKAFAGKARSILEQNAEKAANTHVDLMDSEDDSVRLRASGSILDRVLGKPEGREASGGSGTTINIDARDAQLLITALNESKEIPNGREESAADGPDACGPETGPGQAHQTPELGTGE